MNGPLCVFTDEWFGAIERVLECGNSSFIPTVAKRNRHIAQVAASFGAVDRAVLELSVEVLGRQG